MPPQPVEDAVLDSSEERAYHASLEHLRRMQHELEGATEPNSGAAMRFLLRTEALWNNPQLIASICDQIRASGATGTLRLHRIEGALRTQAGNDLPVALVAFVLRAPSSGGDARDRA